MLNDTKTPSPTGDFSLEDIKGAAATVLIAGNDTASRLFYFRPTTSQANASCPSPRRQQQSCC